MNRLVPSLIISSALLISFLFAGSIPARAGQAEGTGTVWFFRDVDMSTLDPTLFKIVPSFAERLAMLKPDSYFALDLPVGVHQFSWTAAPAKGETLGVIVAAGQQVYVKVRFRGMERVEEREAARRMQTMQPVTRPLAFDMRVSLRGFPPMASSEPRRETFIPDVQTSGSLASGSEAITLVDRPEPEAPVAKPVADPVESPAPAPVDAGSPLTNDDVMMMVEAGLSRELVAAKIRSSRTDFDTSATELVLLKKAGVHESIILLMIEKNAPSGSKPPADPPTTVVAASNPKPETVPVLSPPAPAPQLHAALTERAPRRLSQPPAVLSQPPVAYPEEARRDRIQGLVEIDVVMQPNGTVTGLQLVSSPHRLLSETALHSVSKWQFERPGDLDDSNSSVIFRVLVKFALE